MLHYWPILLLAPGGRQIDPNIDGVERPPWRWVDAKGIGSTVLVLNPPHRSQSLQRTNPMVQTLLLSDLPPHTLLLTPSSTCSFLPSLSSRQREARLLPKADVITATLSKWSCCFLLHDTALRTYKVLRWVSVILAPVSKHAKCRGMVHCQPFRC